MGPEDASDPTPPGERGRVGIKIQDVRRQSVGNWKKVGLRTAAAKY